MIVEKFIEDAIIRKIRLLNVADRVVGAWEVKQDGEVKGESDASDAVISVAVSPRSYDGFMSTQADFNCAIGIAVRRDSCPTGAEIAEITEPLFALLHSWNADVDAVYEDFTVDGFLPGGLQLTGGYGPEYDESRGVWMVSQTFTVRGIID
jgi:hypothetical protein